MAKTRFSWANFPKAFLQALLTSTKGSRRVKVDPVVMDDVDMMSSYVDSICKYPDNQFIIDFRREIEDYFLSGSNSLVKICRSFEKRNYGGIKVGSNGEMLQSLKEKKLTSTIREAYLKELIAYGRQITFEDDFTYASEKTIDMKNSRIGDVPMEDFQEAAVEALDQYFNEEGGQNGILMLPTGGGKTRVATMFLIKHMISQGYQVIWLAHRHMLIDQAADSLYKISPQAAKENKDIEELHMLCISGKHSNVRALRNHDDIIVASVQSLCINTVFLPNILKKKVMIVVDESHHAVAPSYKSIIDTIRKERPDAKLLGLTATPVRGSDKETIKLKNLFDNKIVYQIGIDELIAKGFLATPVYDEISTNEDIEKYTTKDEHRYIKKWGEMPPDLLRKVAESNARNEVIVDQYVKNKDKYGKTLVFALNGYHCIVLNEMFRKAGVKSDYIYTLNKDNDDKIRDFQEGKLDVLININILTEGSDVPDIQTVFLTRPTGSETLLMQMVGRGMRGLGCGGTETINIVDFCDKWTTINKWMHPKHILEEYEKKEEDPVDKETKTYTYEPANLIPAEMIKDLAEVVHYVGDGSVKYGYALPAGWFNIFDTMGNNRKMLVFENQIKPYERMRRMQDRIENDMTIDGKWVFNKCFTGMETAPLAEDLDDLIGYLRKAKEFPELITFDERKVIEPYLVSKKLAEENLHIRQLAGRIKEIYEEHKSLIDSIYYNYESYKTRVVDWIASEDGIVPIGSIVEEVEEEYPRISKEPFPESLEKLMDEVIKEMRHEFPDDFKTPSIEWSENVSRKVFADYTYDFNAIRINSILNFANIPREVLKYLIYHECLHQENMSHDKAFREKEQRYPNFHDWDNWLDYQYPMYLKDM